MRFDVFSPVRCQLPDIGEVRVLGKPHAHGVRVVPIEGVCESAYDVFDGS